MSAQFPQDPEFGTPEDQSQPVPESFDDAFSTMEAEMNTVPQGEFVQLRNGANAPRFCPLQGNEEGITIKDAIIRMGLTLGGVIEYYVENNRVSDDYFLPKGGIVEIVGNVKGG